MCNIYKKTKTNFKSDYIQIPYFYNGSQYSVSPFYWIYTYSPYITKSTLLKSIFIDNENVYLNFSFNYFTLASMYLYFTEIINPIDRNRNGNDIGNCIFKNDSLTVYITFFIRIVILILNQQNKDERYRC